MRLNPLPALLTAEEAERLAEAHTFSREVLPSGLIRASFQTAAQQHACAVALSALRMQRLKQPDPTLTP